MFRGVNILNLDTKGRIGVPTRYRDDLTQVCQGKMVVTVDADHCLLIYPFPTWQDIEQKLIRLSNLNPQTRDLQRLLVGHATEADLDTNGRMLIAPPLRRFAGLEKRVVLIGQVNKFELWDEQRWEEKCDHWRASDGIDAQDLPPELTTLSL